MGIATLGIRMGRLGGAMTRKTGAAPTRRRAARSEPAEATGSLRSAVLRPCASQVQDGERICSWAWSGFWRSVPSVTLLTCVGLEERLIEEYQGISYYSSRKAKILRDASMTI